MASPTEHVEASEIAARIARVAARLFATDGYDATSVRTIVDAAGVTKPTLYYYFQSKEGLAQALLMVPIGRLAEALREILRTPGAAIEKLIAVIDEHFRLCRDDPDRARFAYALFFGPRSSHLSAELAELGQSLAELVQQAIERLAEEGVIARERVAECTAAVRGLIAIYTMDYLYRGQELDTHLAGRLVADLLAGFARHEARSLTPAQRN
ncbi:MAG: TetR/AcrR family transcriptional regulator [Planctomycetia bacterium]|nr:TetR/AcrR family transcriptional regulator [Planctomycetia bacterium]